MQEPAVPFYLAINHQRKPNDKVWYLDRPLGKNEIVKFLKDTFAAAKLDDTNKKVSNHSVRKTSVGRLLEADVQPNFVVHLSSQKFEKPRQLPFSISEATARNVCYPESWARYIRPVRRKPSQYLRYTAQQNVFTVQQIQPQAIFAGVRIDKFEGCTFSINVFCGDQSKIARLNEIWSLSDRGTNRHYLDCNYTFGHFSWIVVSTTSTTTRLYETFCLHSLTKFLSRLDWRPVTLIRKPAKCLSPRREANKIIY